MARYKSSGRNRSSRKSRGRSKGTGNSGWIIAICVCIALIIGVGIGANMLIVNSKIDEATLCHTSGAKETVVVLLDLTDPLSETQQSRLKTILRNVVGDSSEDTMISIGVVSENPANWGAKFAKCKPATGDAANALYENPRMIEEQFQRAFMTPLANTLSEMLVGIPESRSPIMEALQALISETPSFSKQRGSRRIIVASDMLQHSDNLSFYRGQGWDHFSKQNGADRLAGNLTSVDIEILRIPRSGGNVPDNKLVENFWARYFDKQGSRAPSVTSLGDL